MIDENTFYDEEYYEKDDEKNSSKFVNNFLSLKIKFLELLTTF